MSTNDLVRVEIEIDEARDLMDRRNALIKLMDNKDFKTIVSEGFFKNYAIELVSERYACLGHPAELSRVDSNINAIGVFKNYLAVIMARGDRADKDYDLLSQTREEVLMEDRG